MRICAVSVARTTWVSLKRLPEQMLYPLIAPEESRVKVLVFSS